MGNISSKLPEVLDRYEVDILSTWLQEITTDSNRRGLMKETELRQECREFLVLFRDAVQKGNLSDIRLPVWDEVRALLSNISQTRSQRGFSPSETANFIFSFKQPLFTQLRQAYPNDGASLAEDTWLASKLLDQLGLLTMEVYQKSRDEVIVRQQEELLELSTPVVKLWDGILALPLIGTLDSARTQIVMESLLERIVETESDVAIIDITGVPTVDTLTAQHLLKTITAARLMGADCIISGIRPQIAQTIVYLGVDLGDVITRSTMADALALALQRTGFKVSRMQERM
jgi:rsbT co-antagonist protein RsbR